MSTQTKRHIRCATIKPSLNYATKISIRFILVSFVPELLCPAGSLKNMRYAFAYGADAVYAGQPRYSLRIRNNEFNLENLAVGIKEAQILGKSFTS